MGSMRQWIVSGLLLLAPIAAFGAAAYVHDITGEVVVLDSPKSAPRPLKVGDLIDSGNTVRTAGNSNVVLKFEDGQVMVLRDNTTFAVTDYAYNKQQVPQSRAVFNLIAGGLRFITGVIGATNKNAYSLSAGMMTIGIRGTDGDVTFDPVAQAVTSAVNAGALVVRHPAGERIVPANTFVTANRANPPSVPAPTAQAPASIRNAVERSLAQANVPINTPVVLQASAAAAVAAIQARIAGARAEQAKAVAEKAAAAAAQQPNAPGLAAEAAAAQAAATQAASFATAAEDRAQQTLGAAVTAAQTAYAQAISNGASQPSPPAPKPPGPTSGAAGTVGGEVNSLPAAAAGTTSQSGTSSTPSGGAGGGAGGGGTASPN